MTNLLANLPQPAFRSMSLARDEAENCLRNAGLTFSKDDWKWHDGKCGKFVVLLERVGVEHWKPEVMAWS